MREHSTLLLILIIQPLDSKLEAGVMIERKSMKNYIGQRYIIYTYIQIRDGHAAVFGDAHHPHETAIAAYAWPSLI